MPAVSKASGTEVRIISPPIVQAAANLPKTSVRSSAGRVKSASSVPVLASSDHSRPVTAGSVTDSTNG